jgi:hypothetical protein
MAMLLAAGCASRAPLPVPPTPEKAPESPVARFFPIADGRIWAYDQVDEEGGSTGVFVTRAKKVSESRFSLATGNRTRVVDFRPDGIASSDSGIYLLKAPLVAGSTWGGERGGVVRIAATDRAVQVPAGSFVGCIETVEELAEPTGGPNPLRRITTQFCPDVGIASLRVEVWEKEKHLAERATLRSFGEPINLAK